MAILLMGALATPAWAQVQVTGTPSKPDASGSYTVSLNLEHLMPVPVAAGQDWSQTFSYRLPGNVTIRRVRTFYGVDRGDLIEGHLIVQAEDYDLHRTSPHKETPGIYDAYTQSDGLKYRTPPGGAWLFVHALCYPTAGVAVRFHVGVVIEVAP